MKDIKGLIPVKIDKSRETKTKKDDFGVLKGIGKFNHKNNRLKERL